MQSESNGGNSNEISVLVVDDSLVFRRFLRDIFEDCDDVTIVGEAQNGIEALELLMKTRPDVILLDMEMPLMDGMTALQHLMIHLPTPTIMFSSLTREGTARCFDAMKNGAIDFVSKDFIFQEEKKKIHRQLVAEKVRKAAKVHIKSREPVFTANGSLPERRRSVVFCEECGNKEIVIGKVSQPAESVRCSNCGDMIEFAASSQTRRNTFISIVGGGEGSFYNLLEIIPQLEPQMGGALIAVIHGPVHHVDAFTEYLDSISPMEVLRVREGVSLEGGNCYLASGHDYMRIEQHGARLTLHRLQKVDSGTGPLDVLMASVSGIYKNKVAGVILSGEEQDGEKGMNFLLRNGGTGLILDPASCLCKSMGQEIAKQCNLHSKTGVDALVEKIKQLHHSAESDTAIEYSH